MELEFGIHFLKNNLKEYLAVNPLPGIMKGEHKMDERNYSLSDEDLEGVSGGRLNSELTDLKQFETRTVCNVVNYRLKSVLTLHQTPKGRVIPDVFWVNGEKILVHREYKGDGWLFACKDGHFGFVDSNNVM